MDDLQAIEQALPGAVGHPRRAPSAAAPTPALPKQPERRLAAAVLLQAIDDLARSRRPEWEAGSRTGRQAPGRRVLAWFVSDDVAWPFSFRNVCAHLRLDHEAVRARLLDGGRPRTPQATAA